jgi:peptide/nickel transport system permease protein
MTDIVTETGDAGDQVDLVADLIAEAGSPAQLPTPKPFVRRLFGRPAAVVSSLWLLVVALMAIVPRLFTSQKYDTQNLALVLKGPSSGHILGTGELGQDLFARVVYGTRPTAVGALIAVVVAALLGVSLGLLSGYLGGWVDTAVQRFAELLYSIPGLIILLVVYSVFPFNVTAAMTTLGVLFSAGVMRIVRGVTLSTREELFVAAAQVAGLSRRQIILRHLLPRLTSMIIVQVSLLASIAVLVQSSLAFLGFGPRPPRPTWGSLVAEARVDMTRQSWLLVPGGLVVALTVIALNIFGDALRDTATERWTISKLHRRKPKPVAEVAGAQPAVPRPDALVSIQHLTVSFPGIGAPVPVVTDVSFDISPGEVLGIVGESGCGKSMTAAGLLGIIPGAGVISGGSVVFEGRDLTRLQPKEMERVRGKRIGFVSQEPMVALDPTWKVGRQLAEAVQHHSGCSRSEAGFRAIKLLESVNLPNPAEIAKRYPHQVSGGQAQRVAIAMALAGDPVLLIADEPTTALDVTVQAEILSLLRRLGSQRNMAIMLITHNWGVVAELADRAVVMYAGEVVEQGSVENLFNNPLHPYTQGLLRSNPHLANKGERLPTIPGSVPAPTEWPSGCRFAARCPHATQACSASAVALALHAGHDVRCIRVEELSAVGGAS